jgi:hypothetical protein
MKMPKLDDILDVMNDKGYIVFKNPKGFDLNIVGIRTNDMTSNKFNDWLTVFYIENGTWVFSAFPATTDPGTYWRQHPMNIKGTAILKPGQYRSSHKIDIHKTYEALVQKGKNPVTVYRDNNLDNVLNTGNVLEDKGFFGINIHSAGANSPKVDRWSAGCQVFKRKKDFNSFMDLCRRSSKIYGIYFTYTLLKENDLVKGII